MVFGIDHVVEVGRKGIRLSEGGIFDSGKIQLKCRQERRQGNKTTQQY